MDRNFHYYQRRYHGRNIIAEGFELCELRSEN